MRIICIGNRFNYPDNFGMLVYDRLKDKKEIEVVEGGVGGLNLFPYFEDDEEILIVDFGIGFDKKFLTKEDILKIEVNGFNHSNALIFLLKEVKKDYVVYVCNEMFDEDNIDKYVNEIMEFVSGNYKRDVNKRDKNTSKSK